MKNYNTFRIFTVAALLVSAVIVSCKSDDDTTMPVMDLENARKLHIENLYDNSIEPKLGTHKNTTISLFNAAEAFVASPETNTLNSVKEAWKTSFLLWKTMEDKNIGPIQSSFIHTRIHQWPVTTVSIENIIPSQASFNSAAINLIGANNKGYGAIEYLLFENDTAETIAQFTTEENSENRKSFLVALTQNLNEQAIDLQALWAAYETEFKTNLESGVDGSQNKVVNGIIAQLENIKNKKLSPVIDSSPTNTELLEAYRSQQSKEALQQNLETLFNDYKGTGNGASFFSLSQYVSETLQLPNLDTQVTEAFQNASTQLESVSTPLEDSVPISTIDLDQFRTAITNLIVLFKVDISSAANIVVTFNDNDGD